MVPVYPETVTVVLLPVQIGDAAAVALPPQLARLTVTKAVVEYADGQLPLVTLALYQIVAARLGVV
jgi:hypothetical protein